jgi:hypothetical protein
VVEGSCSPHSEQEAEREQEGAGTEMHLSGQAPVAYTYSLSYSGGRDKEDHGSKPTLANRLQDPILKKPFRGFF